MNRGRTIKVHGATKPYLYETLKPIADDMRQNPTQAESVLWEALKRKQLGVKFRRQHIIDRFILDFYSIEYQLAIEANGEIHIDQKDRDEERDTILKHLGITMLRFKNKNIIEHLSSTIQQIKTTLSRLKENNFKSPLGDLGAHVT